MKTIEHYFSEFDNAQVVHEYFGRWPNLHDAELLRIVLDRELGVDFSGPKVTMDVYGCSDWSAEDPEYRRNCKIVFQFDGVELDHLREFNHQNATVEFWVDKYHCDRLREDRYLIKFGSFGAKLEFTCSTVHILSIEPFTPIDYFTKTKSNKANGH